MYLCCVQNGTAVKYVVKKRCRLMYVRACVYVYMYTHTLCYMFHFIVLREPFIFHVVPAGPNKVAPEAEDECQD